MAYVSETANGWPAEGETWNGLTIKYYTDVSGEVTIEGDDGAEVTGDPINGYTITASEGVKDVVVSVPDGVKVVVVVGTNIESITPNGATVKVVKDGNDITQYLDIPESDVIRMSEVVVKQAVADGAEFDMVGSDACVTVEETKSGLFYTLVKGTTLKSMAQGETKTGDGSVWTLDTTLDDGDGSSGFYCIEVGF